MDQSSSCMSAGRNCKLACGSRDKRLTAYIIIYSFHTNMGLAGTVIP